MTRKKKALWSFCLQIPVVIVAFLERSPQVLITYTGGFTGVLLMLVFPALIYLYSKRQDYEERL